MTLENKLNRREDDILCKFAEKETEILYICHHEEKCVYILKYLLSKYCLLAMNTKTK